VLFEQATRTAVLSAIFGGFAAAEDRAVFEGVQRRAAEANKAVGGGGPQRTTALLREGEARATEEPAEGNVAAGAPK